MPSEPSTSFGCVMASAIVDNLPLFLDNLIKILGWLRSTVCPSFPIFVLCLAFFCPSRLNNHLLYKTVTTSFHPLLCLRS